MRFESNLLKRTKKWMNRDGTFKNGALLPEEFVDEICKIINIYKIRRVVFVDLKYIGSSYPFMVNSDISGNLLLSAFVHNYEKLRDACYYLLLESGQRNLKRIIRMAMI